MVSSQALEEFWKFPKFGDGIGFHRLFLLLEALDALSWLEQFSTIKVTGSNGKGSTCAFISEILHAGGWNVGLFISPHLFRFHERI
ncbi:MAG: bifunctional folylpolyglutamate synthase/dihydrofolate synthase, partial [Planctomycetota bacterium]